MYGDDLPQRQPVPQREQHMQQGDRIRAARQGDGHPAAGGQHIRLFNGCNRLCQHIHEVYPSLRCSSSDVNCVNSPCHASLTVPSSPCRFFATMTSDVPTSTDDGSSFSLR